ncbi:MAG: 3-ketoacyl-ACP reductase [Ruminococcaceae bacterium]|nr:3-ketoacyl-ACP reductase [Oscillospiraceae bacterium]
MMKNAIVTGGARGIGNAIAKKLSEDGYRVIIFDILPEEQVNPVEGAVYVRGDLTKEEDRARAIEAAGKVDLLVNNAGVAPRVRADLLETSPEDFDFVMNINLRGTFFLTQAVANHMISEKIEGTIVNMSSMSAYTSSVNRPQYCISKAGVSMCTTLFADRLAEFGIGVFEIRPGIIATDMTSTVTEKYNRLIFEEGILPTRRWGKPEDIANAVSALASGAFSYSTGQVINVDGGFHLRRL